MPNRSHIKLPFRTIPYPEPYPNKGTAEDLFVVLYGWGKLKEHEYARFKAAREIFCRTCDQLLTLAWERGDLDDLY
jgi:hypothetical protein